MAVKIKLARFGKIREPFYRVVVADARTRRSGRAIEAIGKYHPKADPSVIEIDSERAQYWLGVGAQPTESVLSLLKVTGDWQKFKGLPGSEGTLRVAPAKIDKKSLYESALAAVGGDDSPAATTPRRKAAPKKADEAPQAEAVTEAPGAAGNAAAGPAADTAPAATAPADTAPADTTPADTAPADTTPADTAPADTTPADTAPAATEPAAPPAPEPAE